MRGPLCAGMPSEYWSTGDPGNSLAVTICGACEGCPDDDPAPHGVIREGVAYSDTGMVLPPCPNCGRPNTNYRGGVNTRCPGCAVPDLPLPDVKASYRRWILALYDRGMSNKQIAVEAGTTARAVCNIRSRYGRTSVSA